MKYNNAKYNFMRKKLLFLVRFLVAEWPPIWIELLPRLTIFRLFVILGISRFGFEDWIWLLIDSVPDLCIRFTFII